MGQLRKAKQSANSKRKEEKAMYAHRAALVASFILIFTLIGCKTCNVEITSPSQDGQNITTSYTLKAGIEGTCTDCDIDQFKAYRLILGQTVTFAMKEMKWIHASLLCRRLEGGNNE
jgi:hypothetical protein